MSAERSYDQRRFGLDESTTQNNGKRTIFIEHLAPGTGAPAHFRERTTEIQLVSGSVSVFSSNQPHSEEPDLAALEASKRKLAVGETITWPPNTYIKYVVGEGQTTFRCTITPGDADFERLLMIMNGLAGDGKLAELSNNMNLMVVTLDLTGAHPIGPVKAMLDGVVKDNGGEITKLKKDLLEKYDNEQNLQALLSSSKA